MKQNLPQKNRRLLIGADAKRPAGTQFELQPVFDAVNDRVFGYELLFRGPRPGTWLGIDQTLLNYLARVSSPVCEGTLFVNVSNEALLALSIDDFVSATVLNNVVFELSEIFADDESYQAVAAKVTELSDRGLIFALDDFGNGRDGLHRFYSLNTKVTYVKVDGEFLRLCMTRPDAGNLLKAMIKQWREDGITTVAEWVETPEMLQQAMGMGFDLLQGYHIDDLVNQPVLEEECAALVRWP